MKKQQVFLLMMLICLLLFSAALADIPYNDIEALHKADTFNAQLAILNKIALENAAELEKLEENDFWDNGLTLNAAPGIPQGVIPKDWEKVVYTDTDGLPDSMLRSKFIALHCPYRSSKPEFAGDLLARFPMHMRATSIEEADYALIVRYFYVPSGYKYIPSASSSHCDYEAYAINMKTGEIIRFWTHRNFANRSGKARELNGVPFNQRMLWLYLRTQFHVELRHTQEDGTVLIFGQTGELCFLKGFEGELTTLDVPAKVEGHRVTDINKNCFSDNASLATIHLPEGLIGISSKAFMNCTGIESIKIPDTLEYIGWNAFAGCSKLAYVVLGEGITDLLTPIFEGCNNMTCCYVPASLTSGLDDAGISRNTVIYAPEDSYALQWAAENDYEYVVCDNPSDMPNVE